MLDSEESDHIANQEISLHRFGKVLAADNFARCHRSNFFLQKFEHLEAFAIRTHLIGVPTGSVGCVVIAPVIKRDAVWVRRIDRVHRDCKSTRIEAIHRSGLRLKGRSPRMFMIVHHEDAALPIDRTIRSIDQVVGAVMRIGGIHAL